MVPSEAPPKGWGGRRGRLAHEGRTGNMARTVVITGIGLVTPLGCRPAAVLSGISSGRKAVFMTPFAAGVFDCPLWAPVGDFDPERHFPECKTLRLMNRDAQMAVVAARLAIQDARLRVGRDYPGEEIALFGSTGLAGLPAEEAARLARYAAADDGSLDLRRLGELALKRVRPVLSFKILSNMPICFVSIFERICGENAVYAPWEGQGAQAIAAGVRAIRRGSAACALVGGCDTKAHDFAFISLQQLGAFDSWRRHAQGSIPGEGAAFLVLEEQESSLRRGARVYGRIRDYSLRPREEAGSLKETFLALLGGLDAGRSPAVVAAGDGDVPIRQAELEAMEALGRPPGLLLRPKSHLGNLFAAAAAVQVAVAAVLAGQGPKGDRAEAHCFGHGSEQAAFVLEGL